MLINRYGQSKVLTKDEIEQLLNKGFRSSRDKALFAFTFYTACRVSEGRQAHYVDAFSDRGIRDSVILRKSNTKGKQDTRTIPTHPKLAEILEEYYRDSLELMKLKQLTGAWSHMNLDQNGKLVLNSSLGCPKCSSTRIIKQGRYRYRNEQYYLCKSCKHYIRESEIKSFTEEQALPVSSHSSLGVTCSSNYGFLFLNSSNPFLFPGRQGQGCISLRRAGDIYNIAFEKVGIVGASTHSCRRTALTIMHNAGVPLGVIQRLSGHRDLGSLQRYLEVSEEQAQAAVNVLS